MGVLQTLLASLPARPDARALVDIAIVAIIFYWLMTLISGTTAATLVRGIALALIVGFALSNLLNLTMLSWLLRNAVPALVLAVPILFATEIRRALEQLGRARFSFPLGASITPVSRTADVVAGAARQMAERRWGALMVIERGTALGEYAAGGVPIDGLLSEEILLNIFFPNSPLHDGAVIIHGDRVVAAGVVLPLGEAEALGHLGTRHRAAVGISQRSDAIAVVVSEETGRISIANSGRMVRNLSQPQVRKVLSILERAPAISLAAAWRAETREARDGAEPGRAAS